MTHAPLKLAVLVSGQGSNLRALCAAIDRGVCHAEVACVLSDRASAPALAFAAGRGIPTRVVGSSTYESRAAWDSALALAVSEFSPGLVVLAGFMRLIGSAMLERFAGRIINVHPALLPAFPGKDGPAQAVAAKVALSGCTVHVVDAGVDTGPILAQAAVPVLPEDDAATLHARIQTAEHRLLPGVIDAIAHGHYALEGKPRYTRALTPQPTDAFVWPPIRG